jgi:hypothetical protein
MDEQKGASAAPSGLSGLEELLERKADAVAEGNSTTKLDAEVQAAVDALVRDKALAKMHEKLDKARLAEDWATCMVLKARITETNPRTRIAVGSQVRLVGDVLPVPTGTLGIVVRLDKNDKRLPYKVRCIMPASQSQGQGRESRSRDVWFRADQVEAFQHPDPKARGHTGGYRLIIKDVLDSSFLIFDAPSPVPIEVFCDVGCSHAFRPGGGITSSHWACCGQPGLDSACTQVQKPKLERGDVVVLDARLGVITATDPRDIVLPYLVSWEDDSSMWHCEAELTEGEMRERSWAPHTGEFRGVGSPGNPSAVLFTADSVETRVGSVLEYKCSLPAEDEADGPACAHGSEIIAQPHWSCCGRDLFASKCEPKQTKPDACPIS